MLAVFVAVPADSTVSQKIKNVYRDGFSQAPEDMPGTNSVTDSDATIASINLTQGTKYVLLATVTYNGNASNIVDCAILPPSGHAGFFEKVGAAASFQAVMTTVSSGPGTAHLNCTDQAGNVSQTSMSFIQFTAMPFAKLSSTQLP
jgi:hypothetical protein